MPTNGYLCVNKNITNYLQKRSFICIYLAHKETLMLKNISITYNFDKSKFLLANKIALLLLRLQKSCR